jgi:hypothetical protein
MSRIRLAASFLFTFAVVWPFVVNADHDVVEKSSGIKVGLVRAYEPCTAPNTTHDQVVVYGSACGPAVPLSEYRFGPTGRGTAQAKTVSDGLKMKFSLTDVHNLGDAPVNNVTFTGRFTLRFTDHGCSAVDSCTVESFLSLQLPCSNGHCKAGQLYGNAFLPVGLEASVEIVGVDVFDPNGDRFATAGLLHN